MAVPKRIHSPELREGATWHIEWWTESKGKRTRIRRAKTYSGVELNSIADLRERKRVALEFLAEVKKRLTPPLVEPQHTPIVDAMATAVGLKASPKRSTMETYTSNARWFCEFFKQKGWDRMRCDQVRLEHIQEYFDYLILKRKVSNRTHNNRKNCLRALLTELVQRQYFPLNYASQVRRKREMDPIRRPLSESEEQALVNAIGADRLMLFAYVAQRYLGVRPNEIRHLRVGQFDLKAGMLTFPGKDSKNGRNSAVTIPTEIIPVLKAIGLQEYSATHFVLGRYHIKENPEYLPRPEMIGENTLSERFRNLIKKLWKAGLIKNPTGLCFYSLKDTLAVYMLDNNVDVESAMRHLRQRDLQVFQRYVKRLGIINEKVRAMPVKVKLPGME